MFRSSSISFSLFLVAFLPTISIAGSANVSDNCSLQNDGTKYCCNKLTCYIFGREGIPIDGSQNPDYAYNILFIP